MKKTVHKQNVYFFISVTPIAKISEYRTLLYTGMQTNSQLPAQISLQYAYCIFQTGLFSIQNWLIKWTNKDCQNDFFADIVLNFRTTYVNNKGEVVSSSKAIALNYLKFWFIFDLIAALPFDFLYATTFKDMVRTIFTILSYLILV